MIEEIIKAILERTNQRWFIQERYLDEIIATMKRRLCFLRNTTRIAIPPYKLLTVQMLLTMIHPKEITNLDFGTVIELMEGIETTIWRPEVSQPYKLLYSFLTMYTSHYIHLITGQEPDEQQVSSFIRERLSGPMNVNTSTIETADLIRAHYWLLSKTWQTPLLPATYFIIGAGGVGWWVAEFINMFAINSKIIVYDFDSIEPHNFNRLPLSYLTLLEKNDLRKVILLREKLEPIAEMNYNELIAIPNAFTERQLEGVKQEAEKSRQVFFIEATDSPKFQLWIRKALRELGKDNVWLIQGHYDTKFPNMWGYVEVFPAEMIPVPKKEEIERASDYAEGQSIGLPPFLVADVIRLVIKYIDENSGKKIFKLGPFIFDKRQYDIYSSGEII